MKRSRIERKTGLASRGKDYARKHKAHAAWKRSKRSASGVVRFEDGREACSNSGKGKEEYRRRKAMAFTRDEGICCLCSQHIDFRFCTLEHKTPRGMGGGKRDDRLENLGVSHLRGNQAKGSMTLEQYKAKYTPEQRRAICRGEL